MTFVKGHPYGARFKKGDTTGEKNVNWKGGKPKCVVCSKKLSAYHVKACRKHYGQLMRKENHPRYIKDRTKLKKKENKWLSSAYMYWSLDVKNRDGWKCKIADETCDGRLESHHILNWIEYPELRYKINNGITLCHAHHPRGRAKEKRLASTFQELVSVSSE